MKAVIQKNIRIAPLLSFRAGQGKARYFCEVQNREELKEVLAWAHNHTLPYFILGSGSNVLFSDQGFKGLILKLNFQKIKIRKENEKFVFLSVSAGLSLAKLVFFCLQRGWGGLAYFVGIPGTIGGAVYGNAGWSHPRVSIGDLVTRVRVFSGRGLEEEKGTEWLGFAYRSSRLKSENISYVLLEVELKLKKVPPNEIRKRQEQVLSQRQKSIPPGFSAGCIFKNVTKENNLEGFSSSLIPFLFKEKGVIPAGWLIDQCGLKGYQKGGAKISEKHANFIINFQQATATDIYFLIKLAQKKVLEKFGFNLELEIEYVL